MLCICATFRRRKKKKTLILSDGVCFSVTDQNLSKSSKNRLSYILMQFTTNIKAIKRRLYDADPLGGKKNLFFATQCRKTKSNPCFRLYPCKNHYFAHRNL